MTTGDAQPRRESAFTLVRRLALGNGHAGPARGHAWRQEITKNVIDYRTGVVLLAIGFGFVILAVIVLMILFILGLAALTGIPGWVISLVLLLVLLTVAGLLAWRGISKIGDSNFTPEETIAAVKEDLEWAKTTLLRRG